MFLRIKQHSLLLGSNKSSDRNYLYIPIADIEKMEESGGDVTIYYRKFGNNPRDNIVVRDTTVPDLMEDRWVDDSAR